ncbi:hypothetical protein H632_c257p1 [Helicosporidium sp. ATCC 50920]|nr:hypothetical protein H632_c257p1 [Helicosporidium sp. ATCC 50920]|eukprot:KDD76353.1 hypothetical protein H632_c257p1 [Helicosporidium sp. ATCC 50920]
MMNITVKSRSGKVAIAGGINVAESATVDELKAAIAKARPRLYAARQRLSLPVKEGQKRGEALADGAPLSKYGVQEGSVLFLKDLGPQVGYSTVFLAEYAGPLVVYALFYYFPNVLYFWHRGVVPRHPAQTAALAYWCLHYLKRILETLFVHQFSHATMPIFNLAKNCGYYWGFAAFVSYSVNHPYYVPPPLGRTVSALGLALMCQFANLRCHMILANLRPPGSKHYAIPRGFLFDYVTCANYTAEIWGWILFSMATQSLPALIFTAVGAGQMAIWAAAKHKRLRKMFDGKEGREAYPRRWIMFPPFF